ncbi:hypothetical protein TNCV_1758081 [Trichonephila clavipes]|nr:hypothetical protein TNCV_1758081 [Trichonephila clavipes]
MTVELPPGQLTARWSTVTGVLMSASSIRREEEFLGVSLTPPKRVTRFPRLEEGNVPINTSWYGMFLGISRVLGESWTARRYPSADSRPIRKADCVSKKNPLQNTETFFLGNRTKARSQTGGINNANTNNDKHSPACRSGAGYTRCIKTKTQN